MWISPFQPIFISSSVSLPCLLPLSPPAAEWVCCRVDGRWRWAPDRVQLERRLREGDHRNSDLERSLCGRQAWRQQGRQSSNKLHHNSLWASNVVTQGYHIGYQICILKCKQAQILTSLQAEVGSMSHLLRLVPTGCCAPRWHSGSIWQPVHHKGLCYCVRPQHNDQLCTGESWSMSCLVENTPFLFNPKFVSYVLFPCFSGVQSLPEHTGGRPAASAGWCHFSSLREKVCYSNFCFLIVISFSSACVALHRIWPAGNGGDLPKTFSGTGCFCWLCTQITLV